jgi:hypothetical protein
MQEREFAGLAEGMDVYDIDGDKVGTVGQLYRPGGAVASTGTAPETFKAATGAEPYFKVDTGFLGLGKDLFIPASAITDVTGNRVTLNVDKDKVDDMGWKERPTWIPEG